ncbi:hypothetical protein GIB67_006411 [Kingdonia uniflora]|uniref:Vesicle transport protein n=1 Tax=Kingdonia uniflora TaxID=39325 RepID=A0A7J7P0S0_9MAGN|nr:hypothetical protein GIB67_006411 [Kingdonia uniflora]
MWKLLGGGEDEDNNEEENILDNESEQLCSLSPLQRLYAFAGSLGVGFIFMFLSLITFARPIKFAILFTLGNILAVGSFQKKESLTSSPRRSFNIYKFFICLLLLPAELYSKPETSSDSTAFLMGPGRQIRMMFDPVRLYASAIYLGSVFLALICGLLIHNKLLTLLAIIIEIPALIWYSLSYVPFARRMVSELVLRFCDTEI